MYFDVLNVLSGVLERIGVRKSHGKKKARVLSSSAPLLQVAWKEKIRKGLLNIYKPMS